MDRSGNCHGLPPTTGESAQQLVNIPDLDAQGGELRMHLLLLLRDLHPATESGDLVTQEEGPPDRTQRLRCQVLEDGGDPHVHGLPT